MKEHLADWRIHGLAFILTMIAELIGTQSFSLGPLAFSLFPMLYVLIFGAVLGIVKAIPRQMMEDASPYITISVLMLTAKVSSSIGPNLSALFQSSPALILQEFGNLGTALLALPIAILFLHMSRSAIGCTFSISREGSIAIVADRYGLDSPEGVGVMGGYITGTVLGTLFYGIMVSFLSSLNLFHPYSLAMACGTGSASMMSASLSAVITSYPHLEEELTAYAAASNMLSTVDGLYMSLFISLPLCEWMYRHLTAKNKHYRNGVPIPKLRKKEG